MSADSNNVICGCDWNRQAYWRDVNNYGTVNFSNVACTNSGPLPSINVVVGATPTNTPTPSPTPPGCRSVPNTNVGDTCNVGCINDCSSGLVCVDQGTGGHCESEVSSTTQLQVNLGISGLASVASSRATTSVKVQVFDSTSAVVKEATGTLTFNSSAKGFIGSVDLTNLVTGNYTVKAKLQNSLTTNFGGGVSTIFEKKLNTLPQSTIHMGDANNDDKVDLLDFSIFFDCLNSLTSCTADQAILVDFNFDGEVSVLDFNQFIESFHVSSGV